jgi:ABC-type multidrug transport system fused ATPase/permease subunit
MSDRRMTNDEVLAAAGKPVNVATNTLWALGGLFALLAVIALAVGPLLVAAVLAVATVVPWSAALVVQALVWVRRNS